MMISWKTDGSADATTNMQARITAGTNSQYYVDTYGMDYDTWAANNGRTNYKAEVVDGNLVITEEWNLTRAEYDALDIISIAESGLPYVETDDHLSF